MKVSVCQIAVSVIAAAFSTVVGAESIDLTSQEHRLPIQVRVPRGAHAFANPQKLQAAAPALRAQSNEEEGLNISTQSYNGVFTGKTLPLWTFNIKGSRDGDHHIGAIVGHDPFRNPGTDQVPTYIVPLVIRTHMVATAYDPTTGYYSTAPGVTTIDPTENDHACLTRPNNNPIRLVQQSPIFSPAHFVFGGTDVGTTQYVDAFQRANFWQALGGNADEYHVLLAPVITLPPVFIDVPATAGLALTDPNLFQAAYGFSYCAPFLLVDINWFDSYLTGTVIPSLAKAGVGPTNLPFFTTYNAAWPVGDVTFIGNCCAVGYHGATGVPLVDQSYGVADFDTTGWFLGPPQGLNTEVQSHEIAEWMNDPFVSNETAPWGGSGQVSGCQANLEVGDPLTGSDVAPVTMPNGFTYNLQELAFFSWFFGAPSVGANGWYSNNDTFTTDAGGICPVR